MILFILTGHNILLYLEMSDPLLFIVSDYIVSIIIRLNKVAIINTI